MSTGNKHWLVEVRSAAGTPNEASVYDVVKHMRTWRNLGRQERLEAGVLIINHEYRQTPAARTPAPFPRDEFAESLGDLGVAVIATTELCRWWAQKDCAQVISAITSSPKQYPSS
jgi:hypothetical protein